MESILDNPKHWRERAVEARIHAEQIADPESKKRMLRNSEDYEKLAKRTEGRQRGERWFQTEALPIGHIFLFRSTLSHGQSPDQRS